MKKFALFLELGSSTGGLNSVSVALFDDVNVIVRFLVWLGDSVIVGEDNDIISSSLGLSSGILWFYFIGLEFERMFSLFK